MVRHCGGTTTCAEAVVPCERGGASSRLASPVENVLGLRHEEGESGPCGGWLRYNAKLYLLLGVFAG